jgi:hypothetical protein
MELFYLCYVKNLSSLKTRIPQSFRTRHPICPHAEPPRKRKTPVDRRQEMSRRDEHAAVQRLDGERQN